MDTSNDYQILNEDAEFALKEIADLVIPMLPKGFGMTLLLYKLGDNGEMYFVNNVNRRDMIEAMRKFVALQDAKDAGPKKALPPGNV